MIHSLLDPLSALLITLREREKNEMVRIEADYNFNLN